MKAEFQRREAEIIRLFGPETRLSQKQIAEMLKRNEQCVTPRVAALIEKKALIEEGSRTDPVTRRPQGLLRLPTGQKEIPL